MKRSFNKLNLFILIFSLFLTSCDNNFDTSDILTHSTTTTRFVPGKNYFDEYFDTKEELFSFAKELINRGKNGDFNIIYSDFETQKNLFNNIYFKFYGETRGASYADKALDLKYIDFNFTHTYWIDEKDVALYFVTPPLDKFFVLNKDNLYYEEIRNDDEVQGGYIYSNDFEIATTYVKSYKREIKLSEVNINFNKIADEFIENMELYVL